jgi:hypothetical protein
MTVSVHLSDESERKLIARARAAGEDASDYVRRLVERDLAGPSLDEVLAPFRDEVQRSGMTDQQLDELVDQARAARFDEQNRKRI